MMTRVGTVTKLISILCCLASASPGGSAGAELAQPTNRERAVAIDMVPMIADEAADLERLARGLARPWSLAFTPNGELLITEKYSGVRVMRDGVLQPDVLPGGPPQVLAKADSGCLDIALDPDFAANRLIYLAFAEGDEKANRVAVWKVRYDGDRLAGGQVIFRARPDKAGTGHPGGRILFLPDKTFLLTVGDGYDYKSAAQDPRSHLGKTLRLTREGGAPDDNPFVGRAGFLPEIWTLGHRNAQGLARDAETGEIWLHEHGPRGGDELNLLRAGANYGWPVVTHGIDYDGKLISDRTFAPGFERAHFFWAPSIAPSGLLVYRGNDFPDWQGRLLVGGLAYRSIVRLRRGKDTGLFVEEARMFVPVQKRIRDLREGPDGLIYVLTDEEDGELLRLRPRAPAK
jgi:glucose/arabinose dehydrogenase